MVKKNRSYRQRANASKDIRHAEKTRRYQYYLVGNEVFLPTPGLQDLIRLPVSPELPDLLTARGFGVAKITASAADWFRYDYLFRHPRLPEFQPEVAHLIPIGLSMTQAQKPGPAEQD